MKANLFQRVARWVAVRAARLGGVHPRSPECAALFGFTDTGAGIPVSEWTALNYSAVYAAVRLLSESVASLPFNLYQRIDSDETRVAFEHPVHKLIAVSPNPEMTAIVFKETIQAHVLTWGDGYAEIERTKGGVPIALWPITPNRVAPDRSPDGRLFYRVYQEQGPPVILEPENIIHIPGLGFDGLKGYAPIALARESIALGLATQRFGASYFGNGATPGGVITYPGELSPRARENLRESWNRVHQGPHRAHRVAILEEGADWKPISIPPEHSQFLETRKFEVVEIARWFNVPPHMLRDLDRATFSNIEHQGMEFVTYSLRPWLIRWEQEINRKLLREEEKGKFFSRHRTDELERADIKTRYECYAIGRQWGWWNADEIRAKEGENPLPNGQGKVYLSPLNMDTPEGNTENDGQQQTGDTEPQPEG